MLTNEQAFTVKPRSTLSLLPKCLWMIAHTNLIDSTLPIRSQLPTYEQEETKYEEQKFLSTFCENF